MGSQVYVVAVSGGVDSMVLLHKLMQVKPERITYVVAHVDHGIRQDSGDDAEFVRDLAKQFGLKFELKKLALGKKPSEDEARIARYDFLFSVLKKHKAEAIVTAHHQDDVLETMFLNMLRGTSPRGLVGFSRRGIIRPLIDKSKQEILNYAAEHKLSWREDSTNADTAYLRNYVRAHLMPKLDSRGREKLLQIRSTLQKTYIEIDDLAKKLLFGCLKSGELLRHRFVILPYTVQLEMIAAWFRMHEVAFESSTLERAVLSIKTQKPGKHIELNKGAKLFSEKKTIVLKVDGADV